MNIRGKGARPNRCTRMEPPFLPEPALQGYKLLLIWFLVQRP